MSRFTKASDIDEKQQDSINQLVREWGSAQKKMKKRTREQKEERRRKKAKSRQPKRLINGGFYEEDSKTRDFDYVEDNAMDSLEDGSTPARETYVDTTNDLNMINRDDNDKEPNSIGDTKNEESECEQCLPKNIIF